MKKNKLIKYILLCAIVSIIYLIILFPFVSTEKETILSTDTLNIENIYDRYYVGEDEGTVFITDTDAYFYISTKTKFSEVDISVDSDSLNWKPGGAEINVYLAVDNAEGSQEYSSKTISVDNPTVTLKLPYGMYGEDDFKIGIADANGYYFKLDNLSVYYNKPLLTMRTIFSAILIACITLALIIFGNKFYINGYIDKIGFVSFGLFAATIIFYLLCFLSRGQLLPALFYPNVKGSFMDFVSLINESIKINPYDVNGNYPAFAYIIIRFYGLLIQKEYLDENTLVIKELQATKISLVFFLVMATLLMLYLIDKIMKFENENSRFFFRAFVILSAPVAYTVERGNIVIWAFVFTLFYVAFYESDKKYMRELSYIALAAAFAIKIYPAIFGILLLRRKRFVDALKTAGYGILLFVLPFAYYGFQYGISHFIQGMVSTSTSDNGMGNNVSMKNIVRTFLTILNIENDSLYIVLLVVAIIALLIVALLHKDEHVALLSITLIMIALPPYSYYYSVIFMIIPFMSFIKNIRYNSALIDKVWFALYACILVPMALPLVEKLTVGYKTCVSYASLIEYGSVFVMEAMCTVIAIKMLIERLRGVK